MARTSHLPNAGAVVAWGTLRLVTKESHKVLEAGPPRLSFHSDREISPTDSEPMAVPSRVGHTVCGIEPLGELGKANCC